MTRMFAALSAAIALCACGCTTPNNKVSDQAMTRGIDAEHRIVDDLRLLAMQMVVDACVREARDAARSGNPDAAGAAVERAVSQVDRITWLAREQHQLALSMLRIGHRYIWEQRGILSIWWEDLESASERAQLEAEAALNGPASAPSQ